MEIKIEIESLDDLKKVAEEEEEEESLESLKPKKTYPKSMMEEEAEKSYKAKRKKFTDKQVKEGLEIMREYDKIKENDEFMDVLVYELRSDADKNDKIASLADIREAGGEFVQFRD